MSGEAGKKPVVASVINLKGGVGKTTVVALLARHAARKGLKVLAVDLDPQANLSQALMDEDDYKDFMGNKEPSIVELFNGYRPPSPTQSAPAPLGQVSREVGHGGNLSLIPSRFDFSDKLISSVRAVQYDERVLAKYIADNAIEKDIVLIDCAPTESRFTRTAYHASRYVLVPVRTEFFSTIGFPLLKESLEKFRLDNLAHVIDVCGVLINNTRRSGSRPGPHHKAALADIRAEAKNNKWRIMRNQMWHSDGYPKLMKEAYPTHTGNAPGEFREIADEFLKMMGFKSQEGSP